MLSGMNQATVPVPVDFDWPAVLGASTLIGAGGIDDVLNRTLAPLANRLSEAIFYEVSIGGVEFPLIVAWLIATNVELGLVSLVVVPPLVLVTHFFRMASRRAFRSWSRNRSPTRPRRRGGCRIRWGRSGT